MVIQYCLVCGERNHLEEPENAEAFECANCTLRFWIDDQCRLEYMVRTGRSFDEAEQDLQDGKPVFC